MYIIVAMGKKRTPTLDEHAKINKPVFVVMFKSGMTNGHTNTHIYIYIYIGSYVQNITM